MSQKLLYRPEIDEEFAKKNKLDMWSMEFQYAQDFKKNAAMN